MIDVLHALIGCFTVQHKCSAGTDLDGESPANGVWAVAERPGHSQLLAQGQVVF